MSYQRTGQQPLPAPSPRTIAVPRWLPVPEGPLGDSVRRATQALGLPHCRPCDERQHRWNQVIVSRGR